MENDVRCLVKAVTGFEENSENFRICVQFVNSNFKYHRYLDVNSNQVQKTIKGLCDKFVIYCQDRKAETFKLLVETFLQDLNSRTSYGSDLAYSLLSLLLNLSRTASPTDNELSYVDDDDSALGSTEDVDWGKYLLEGELNHSLISYHEYSEDEDEIVEDTEEQAMSVEATTPPQRDDSGIDIAGSTDSKTNSQGPLVSTLLPEPKGRAWLQNNIVTPYWNTRSERFEYSPLNKTRTSNILKYWEGYLDTFQLSGKSDQNVLSERIILREVLWMLRGISDLTLFCWKDGCFEVKSVQLCHVTDLTLQNLLTDLCCYGSYVKHLQQFIKVSGKSDFRSSVCCQTYQAFADGIAKSLNCFFQIITKLEKKLIDQNETVTLIRVIDELNPYFEDIKIIYAMYEEGVVAAPSDSPAWNRSIQLLTILFKYLNYHTTWTSNDKVISLALIIFIRTFRPYLKLLDDFISEGYLNDPWEEFIIQQKEVISILDENFWKNAFLVHPIAEDMTPNFILKPLLSHIVLAGKSMELIRHLGCANKAKYINNNIIEKPLYPEFLSMLSDMFNITSNNNTVLKETMPEDKEGNHKESLLNIRDEDFAEWLKKVINNNSLLHHNFSNKIEHINLNVLETPIPGCEQNAVSSYSDQYPIAVTIKTVLYTCIGRKCQLISKMLIDIMKQEYKLLNHMEVTRKFFLMEIGDVLFSFYSEIFEKLCHGESWLDMSFLTTALQDALIEQDLDMRQKLAVNIDINHSTGRSNRLSELSLLCFSYKVSWPVNIVLNFSSQQKYREIFSFLLQVKCAKYALDELRFEELKTEEDPLKALLCGKDSELPKKQKMHSLCLLRMRLLHFINSFHSYIMTQIHQHGSLELQNKLKTAVNIEQILNTHNQYLSQIYECSLLHPKYAVLKEAVTLILNLALVLQHCWKNRRGNIETEKLLQIEKNFSQCIQFLHLHLKTVVQNRVISHLQVLSYCLLSQMSLPPVMKK